MSPIQRKLEELGLDEKEKKIIAEMLGKNRLTAYKLSKKSKIHKSTCYDVLKRLIDKQFVIQINLNKTQYYELNNLDTLIESLKEKEKILTEINSFINTLEEKKETTINILEKSTGQNEFNTKLLNLAKNKKLTFCYITGNAPPSSIHSELKLFSIIKTAVGKKLKIDYKGIWEKGNEKTAFFKEFKNLGNNKLTDKIGSEVTTILFDKHVAHIISGKPIIIVIKNELVCEEMKKQFNIIWNTI